MISHIDYEKLGREISPLNKIFLSLSSQFTSAQEVDTAEDLIMDNVRQFVSVYQKHF